MNNKEIILTAALDLYNANGAVLFTTNHLAKAAGISPGNLYYHFKNKEQIIRELFNCHLLEIAELWSFTDNITAESLAGSFSALAESQYRYRFFYRDITALLAADPELSCRYHQNKLQKMAALKSIADKLSAAGLIDNNNQPYDWTVFFELTFLSTDYWLARTFCEHGFADYDSKRYLLDIWQNLKILYSGYLNSAGKEFISKVDKFIAAKLQEDKP